MNITLCEEEISRAKNIASARNGTQEGMGFKTNKWTKARSGFDSHFIGLCGELAGAKALGAVIDDSIYIGGDDGTDVVAFGLTWQIKTSTYTGDDVELKFNRPEDFKSQAAMLVQSKSIANHLIVGVIGRKKFLTIAKKVDYGYGQRLAVIGGDLTSMSQLSRIVHMEWLRDYDSCSI